MALETIPLKIFFRLTDDVNGNLPLPRCTIRFNGKTLAENVELDNPQNVTSPWQEGKKISIKEFQVDIDDDIEETHNLEIQYDTKLNEVWHLLKDDPEAGGNKEDYGAFIHDIEINEISIESLIYTHGKITATICPESEFETHGFIDYLRSIDQVNEISIVDNQCVWNTHSNYLSVEESLYTFEVKTPLYLWLLELLLQ